MDLRWLRISGRNLLTNVGCLDFDFFEVIFNDIYRDGEADVLAGGGNSGINTDNLTFGVN